MSNATLAILMLEDSPADAELVQRSLSKADIQFRLTHIETKPQLEEIIKKQSFDLILSDFNLQGFDGSEALAIAQKYSPDTPFIFVTGTLGEEKAVEMLKSGAADFVLKGGLKRLPHSIWRALREANEITERRIMEMLLKESQERLELALKGAEMGTWNWDMRTDLIVHNTRWATMLGYTPGEVGPDITSMMELIHPQDHPLVKKRLEAHLSGKTRVYQSEHRLLSKTGEWKWVLDRGKIVEWSLQNTPLRMAGTHLDITEKKLMEEELIQTTKDLKLINKDLEEFAYVSSHNLRAPVANLIGLMKLCYGPSLDREAMDIILEKVNSSVHQLNDTLDSLTDILSKRRKDTKQSQLVFFDQVFAKIEHSISFMIEQSGAILEKDFSDAPSIYYPQADIENVIHNLITNALKFTQPGQYPLIQVKSFRKNGYVCISVKDDGIGMNLQLQGGKLFKMFQRLNEDYEGKGLGLYIVKSQIEALKGKVEVESEEGRGSTFTLYFKNQLNQTVYETA